MPREDDGSSTWMPHEVEVVLTVKRNQQVPSDVYETRELHRVGSMEFALYAGELSLPNGSSFQVYLLTHAKDALEISSSGKVDALSILSCIQFQ